MNRRGVIALSLAMALTGLPAAASVTDEVLRDLRVMGYDQITVSRTLLGRERITATGPEGWREIIVNPRTGEILRDVFIRARGGSGRLLDDGDGGGEDNSRDVFRDDDRDDDRDDRDDSDNSGSGSDGGGDDSSGGDDD